MASLAASATANPTPLLVARIYDQSKMHIKHVRFDLIGCRALGTRSQPLESKRLMKHVTREKSASVICASAMKYFLRQQRDNKNRRPSIFDMTLPKENSTAQVMDQDVLPTNKNSATAAPQPITDQVLWLNQMMQHQKYMYDVALFAMP